MRRRDHEQQMADELARLKGSRAVRYYFQIKNWFRRVSRPSGLFSGWRSTGARAAAANN